MRKLSSLPDDVYPHLAQLLGLPIANAADLTDGRQRMPFASLQRLREHVPLPPQLDGAYRDLAASSASAADPLVSSHTATVASTIAIAELIFGDEIRTRAWWLILLRYRARCRRLAERIAIELVSQNVSQLQRHSA